MHFDPENKKLKIGVSELCRTVVNHESIDVTGARIFNDGGRLSELYAERYGACYEEGKYLSVSIRGSGLFYEISGKCDGILRQNGKVTVCVNRSVNRRTDFIEAASLSEHIGNAVLLAYMTAQTEMLSEVKFLLSVFHTKTDIKTVERTYSKRDLFEAVIRIIDLHRPFAALEAERLTVRIPSMKSAEFPYPEMRSEQRDFIIEVLRAVKGKSKALIEAPTGTGKTMASLFPAVKSHGAGLIDKTFYFTSKNTTAAAALEALKKLSPSKLRAVRITAKDRLCPINLKDPTKCRPSVCPRAREHYRRAYDAICDIVTNERIYDTDLISRYAAKHSVCPYELALDLSNLCDIVICDCNYLIDEAAYLRRFFSPDCRTDESYLFLFDEAHNLIDRAKACYSAELKLSDFTHFLAETRAVENNPVIESMESLAFYINSMRELCADSTEEGADGKLRGFTATGEFDKGLYDLLTAFVRAAARHVAMPGAVTLPDSLFDLSKKAKKYLTSMELFDSAFTGTVAVFGDEVITKIICNDPSELLAAKMALGRASVMFSATLTPLDYYASVYGAKDSTRLALDCPYDRKNLCVCIMDKLSVKYQDRNRNAGAIADAIMSAVGAKDGNYMVYFPSYEYMIEVQTLFKYKYPHIRTVMQSKNMSESARHSFLDSFMAATGRTLVGFCVLGGIYAEGIDLVGDRLIGSVIVGVGLVRPSEEGELLRKYYDDKFELGREFAYIYPGFNRVLQAAGRVIRSETDRGVVVFIDERYAEEPYKSLLPSVYRGAKLVGDGRSLSAVIESFWKL